MPKCQNCAQQFNITDEDREFYKKVKVPEPSFCPDCRLQRRMLVSNERALYKAPCDLCEKDTITIYHEDKPFPVYCMDCWKSDKWDPLDYAQTYDSKKPFFEQLKELKNKVPRVALIQQFEMVGSQYCNRASNNKNCYLCFRTNFSEDCMYSLLSNNSNDCVDSFNVQKCELAYSCVDCAGSYNIKYCQECKDCTDSAFLYDCRNCQNCFGCVGLRGQQYHIFNKPYSKEDYSKKIKEFKLNDYQGVEDLRKRFGDFALNFIRKYMMETHSTDVSGNWIIECKNVLNSYSCRDVEDAKYTLGVMEAKDCMDYMYWGRNCELMYEISNCGYNCSRLSFSNECFPDCNNLEYCDNCRSSSDLFGSVGVKSKKYCILNKEYSKEEYQDLVAKIRKDMDEMPYKDKKGKTYKYGEFFPSDLTPFAYNETAAQEYFPLTKQEALKQGYGWREPEEKDTKPTIEPGDLPGSIKIVSDSITKEIIGCEHKGEFGEQCTTVFKIIPQELEYYKKHDIPLPRLCPNCRHYGRLKQRNPLKLWPRKCQCAGREDDSKKYKNTVEHPHHKDKHCPNEFETSYAPDRKEIVYCEECYLKEVG